MLFFLLATAAARAQAPARPFITVAAAHLMAGAQRFSFVGANVDVMHGPHARATLEATLDAVRADGLTVVRVWALGEDTADAAAWPREHVLFRAGPDGWIDAGPRQLDRVLAAAAAHDLRVIVTLANHWSDYGGVPMYLRWAGLPVDGWGARDRFYADARTRAWYAAHVERLVTRTNQLTGVRYADDPTLLAWELINESQVDSDDGARARSAWIAEMAARIRAHDGHHLITPGVIGYTTRAERTAWLAVCRLPAVDYCDSHFYPQSTDAVDDAADLAARLDDRVGLAALAHKPLVIGELGFRTDQPRWLDAPRASWFARALERLQLDGAAGALVWIYQPWSGAARDYGVYIDRPDTDDVRTALAHAARAPPPTGRNRRLDDVRAEGPLYDPYRTVRHDGAPRLWSGGRVIELDPARFAEGRWERIGTWNGGGLVETYGSGDGAFSWRFAGPPRPTPAQLRARVSSEFPGATAPPDGWSHVTVAIDGRPAGAWRVVPDDGAGRVETLALGTLAAGAHTLTLAVPPGPAAHGLCVYGLPSGRAPPPAGETLPIQIILQPE